LKALILSTALALAPMAAQAADALACVERYLGRLSTLSTDFVQVVQDKRGDVTDRASGTLALSPAMLLSGSAAVGDAFVAVAVEKRGDLEWCRLAPKQPGSDFDRVSLAFNRANELAAMELVDKLGQTTTIQFSRLRRDAKFEAATFRFEPPKGADVIGETAAR
jgi:outer membrane lipoprotein-sorting protein